MPAQLCTRRQLLKQPRLADSRLTHELDGTRVVSIELVEGPLENIELVATPDEVSG